jgi:hypothetical protein
MLKKITLSLLFLSCFSLANAQVEKMQAAFIYNFTMLVSWPPASQSGDFVIAVMGNSPINQELETMAKQKKAGNQTIVIKKIASADEATKSNIVFIADSQKSKIGDVASKTSGSPVLIVTESDGAIDKGAVVNFTLVQEKLRFELSESKASSRNLKLAANLIKLAIIK